MMMEETDCKATMDAERNNSRMAAGIQIFVHGIAKIQDTGQDAGAEASMGHAQCQKVSAWAHLVLASRPCSMELRAIRTIQGRCGMWRIAVLVLACT